jgi:hypothetical protein
MSDHYIRYKNLALDWPALHVLRVTLNKPERRCAGWKDARDFAYNMMNFSKPTGPTFDTSLALEFLAFTGLDVKEGIASIREKRSPKFSDRSPV